MWLIAALAVAVAGWTAEPPAVPGTIQVQVILTGTPTGEASMHLKLLVLNEGASHAPGTEARVTFTPANGAPTLELAAPGPRSLTVPLNASEWAPDHTEVVDLGEFSLAPPCPPEVVVRGGLAGQDLRPLGTLQRGPAGTPAAFLRAYPQAAAAVVPPNGAPAGGRARLLFVAAYEPSADGQFYIKLACLNCGEKLTSDQDLFLHFEPSPVGSDLAATTALGLFPSGKATDSSAWSEGDLAVIEFGPFRLQDGLPEFVYLRAGLYNRQGDGARVPVAGPDDTSRALVGRLVTREGRTWFERAPLSGAQVPAGWETPKKGAGKR